MIKSVNNYPVSQLFDIEAGVIYAIPRYQADPPDSLKPFGLTEMGVADVAGELRAIYGLRR